MRFRSERGISMANYIYSDEDNAPMNEEAWENAIHTKADPIEATTNCHERCRYSKECFRLFECKGSNRKDFPDECALYYKLDDLSMEARDIAKEQSKALDDELPFTDDYDGPEETGEF